MVGYSDACTAYYDNSKAFKDYLADQGITKDILHLFGLVQKPIHTIIPHVMHIYPYPPFHFKLTNKILAILCPAG